MGYTFIGDAPAKKPLSYVETWKTLEKYFVKNGHTSVKPYPTVCRWRDDLYFTIASINDFQPYVVNGEIEPPGNPLIVPQTCIRFSDIANVGVTGRHFTNFVMVGQHAFNTKKTGQFYWKEEAISHDLGYLKALGIDERELVFQEDVWMGGGNFGPCIEYFAGGLELGNCVFMQYAITSEGTKELPTKVIDMGAGLNRLAWITHGAPTSYEIVFGSVIEKMKRDAGVDIEKKLFLEYAKLSGGLDVEEAKNYQAEKEMVATALGTDVKTLFGKLRKLQSLYAAADHICTVLFTTTDGMLPSNSGGGYNLRMILRRVFAENEELGLNIDYAAAVAGHARELREIFPHLGEGVATTVDVIAEERKKYAVSQEKGRGKVANMIAKARGTGRGIGEAELVTLYQSDGIPPELVEQLAAKEGFEVKVPDNFYAKVRHADEEVEEKKMDLSEYEKTAQMYYEGVYEFDAKVAGVKGKYVILDKTAFYPEGGGQCADAGSLNGERVVNVAKEAGVALHEVAHPEKFKSGMKVHGEVDRERRLQITRNHSAVHLLNAAARKVLGNHVWQGGSYKDEHKATLDITHYKHVSKEQLWQIERLINDYVMADMPIALQVLPRGEAEGKYGFRLYQGGAVPGKELRVVSIGDVDHEACGGTHYVIKRTGEIGPVRVVKCEGIQDGFERITIKAGKAAAEYSLARERLLEEASESVKVPPEQLPATVRRFFEEWKERGKSLEQYSKVAAEGEAERIVHEANAKGQKIARAAGLPYPAKTLGMIAESVSKKGIGVVLVGSDGYVVARCPIGAGNALELLKKEGAVGGGNESFAQGKIVKR
jgi:alanyl-tRNA synthetase